MLRIRVGGATIYGGLVGRPEGLFVVQGGFEGWEDGGGDARREAVPRPSAHGEFDLPVFHGPRVVSVQGVALAASDYELGHLRSVVNKIGADGGLFRVTVEQQGQTVWGEARRGAKTTFKDSGIRGRILWATFQMQWVFPDPRKYGKVRTFPAGVPAVHYGNFPATPRLLVGAGSGGYTVTGPGGRVVTVGTAPAAAHYIDFAEGGLFTSAGVRQVGAITTFQPWTVGPGLPGVTASISGSRSLVQQVTDTFI